MPKVKKPRIKTPEREEEQEPLPPAIRETEEAVDYGWLEMRQKIATYAFGTVICLAVMVTMAAWMGGSLGAFGQRLTTGMDVIAQNAGFSIRKIDVIGLDPIVEERARDLAAVQPGQNMFGADPYAIRKRVETLEAVAGVSVHRLWPDQITIVAETREPMALWQSNGEWRVIDQRGRAFAKANPDAYMNLPRLIGPGADAAAAGLLTTIADFPELKSRMTSAVRVGERRWDVRFEGVTVALPEDAGMKDALASLNLLQARNRVLELAVTRIDARDPERFAIRPAPGGPGNGGV